MTKVLPVLVGRGGHHALTEVEQLGDEERHAVAETCQGRQRDQRL